MDTYRISAPALLRLAAIASEAPGVDAGEVLGILHGAVLDEPEAVPGAEDGAGAEGATKPSRPE